MALITTMLSFNLMLKPSINFGLGMFAIALIADLSSLA